MKHIEHHIPQRALEHQKHDGERFDMATHPKGSMLKTALRFMVAAGVLAIFSITSAYAGLCDRYACEKSADEIISRDARGWLMNRYDQGSARVRDVLESSSGRRATLTVDYTYNGGMKGWVEIELDDGAAKCLRYHDFQHTCRNYYK
jgi:hypothetical protein